MAFTLEVSFCREGKYFLVADTQVNLLSGWMESNAWVHHLTVALLLPRSAGGRRLRERKGPYETVGLSPAAQAPEDLGTRLLTKRAMESSSHLEKICELKVQPQHQGWKRCFIITRAGLKIYVRKPQTWWALITIRQRNCESRWTWTTRLSFRFIWGWASAAQGPRAGQITLLNLNLWPPAANACYILVCSAGNGARWTSSSLWFCGPSPPSWGKHRVLLT